MPGRNDRVDTSRSPTLTYATTSVSYRGPRQLVNVTSTSRLSVQEHQRRIGTVHTIKEGFEGHFVVVSLKKFPVFGVSAPLILSVIAVLKPSTYI